MRRSVAVDENQIIAERRSKLAALRAAGHAYPNDFRRDALAADLHAAHDAERTRRWSQRHCAPPWPVA